MFSIGIYSISAPTVLAPMAGISDLPFRQLCRGFGAGLTVSEMITADTSLWHTDKSRWRLPHGDEPAPRMVQIAGGDPQMLANAARENVRLGAQIIDINMGCPAKKVCKRAAGSALLSDEKLVAEILDTVVKAVDVPVTLKIRTGANPENRNAKTIARIAENAGIQALTVHGRTRACKFRGCAEYDTIADIVSASRFPVIANGDIDSPTKARDVLNYTGAAAVMIGRSAQGHPWIFREINHFLATGQELPAVGTEEIHSTLYRHITALHRHYGDFMGVRIARKHLGWYLQTRPDSDFFRQFFNKLENSEQQLEAVNNYFNNPIIDQECAA